MSTPTAEPITRQGDRTMPDGNLPTGGPARWPDIDAELRSGRHGTWLSVPKAGRVHTRPVFAAWTGSSFVVASNPGAVKTRHLENAAGGSLAVDLGWTHLVVEVEPRRLVAADGLERARRAFEDVYEWPTVVEGELLDAPYAAPTSGGPPFHVYELVPTLAHAFPTDDSFEPTRFRF